MVVTEKHVLDQMCIHVTLVDFHASKDWQALTCVCKVFIKDSKCTFYIRSL